MKKAHPSLLIVDDALFMREVIKDCLGELFDRLEEAGSVQEALQILDGFQPDVITLDLSLDAKEPVQGLSLLKQFKEAAPRSQVIVVSALDQTWLSEQVMEAGASVYLVKPFEKARLRKEALALLEESHE